MHGQPAAGAFVKQATARLQEATEPRKERCLPRGLKIVMIGGPGTESESEQQPNLLTSLTYTG